MTQEEYEDDIDMGGDEDDDDEEQQDIPESEKKVYIPGVSQPLEEGETLEPDLEAYELFHSFETAWPCLSFDFVRDGLGDRSGFPLECYMVSGTQADKPRNNELLVMGMKNLEGLHEAKSDDESSDDSEDEDEETKKKREPKMHAVAIKHHGGINRIRADRLGDSSVCAVWNDQAKVQIWNLTNALNQANAMTGDSQTIRLRDEKPLFSYAGSNKEGYALGWSPSKKGTLATGDCSSTIYIWNMMEGGLWAVDQKPLMGHNKSVEDVAWSPKEQGLLASCSSDGTVRMWDTRVNPNDACVCTVEKAHDADVNVLSWNEHDDLIVTGGDDGQLKIWSLKTIQFGQPVARFKHHTAPITSVEWHPQDDTTFMASGEDDQTTIWDIATEADGTDIVEGVPPQLMFLHLGQHEVKEVHWHPQVPGVAMNTALSGFNLFKTINV